MVELGGMIRGANGGKIFSQRTNCATDTFSIGNAPNVPTVCGTLTGDHGKYIRTFVHPNMIWEKFMLCINCIS